MYVKNNTEVLKSRKTAVLIALFVLLLLVIVSVFIWVIASRTSPEIYDISYIKSQIENDDTNDSEQNNSSEPQINYADYFDKEAIKSTVDEWLASTSGNASISIMSEDGEVIYEVDAERKFFAASLYKLYAAYFGYLDIDSGESNKDDTFLNGKTRGECLDAMIRSSDSPCGEKLLAEFGGQTLNERLEKISINNTSMINITTTANDASSMLATLLREGGLSNDSLNKYLDSMKNQDELYRRGLPSGFTDTVNVFNKVGWNEQKEWHDAAIVQFAPDKRLIVSILSENVGSRKISQLGSSLEEVALKTN